MPILSNYNSFNGRHWETGSVHNHLAARGVVAPHTGKPYSEAFFLGISGGIVLGYFVFTYEGVDPHARILTRNTFDPMDIMLERLGIIQDLQHTASADKAVRNLVDSLEEGVAPIVWADLFSLPYNSWATQQGEQIWMMNPVVVFGYDEAADTVHIADRSNSQLTVTTADLVQARSKVKKIKHRILNLDPPYGDKLASAVQMSIWGTIKLYTEKPPKGSKKNFGFAAFQNWADSLVKTKGRRTWAKDFPPGSALYTGLADSYYYTNHYGQNGVADRVQYADFLDEAAVILDRAALKEVGQKFRASAKGWEAINLALLPNDVDPLRQTRELMARQHQLFLADGQGSVEERQAISAELDEIKKQVSADFPLDEAGIQQLKENLADKIMAVHDIEYDAIMSLQEAMD